jgi:pilus assembly protein CpaF
MSLDLILPFLQPIAHIITDLEVSEVMVNANGTIFLQRNGRLEPVAARLEEKHLAHAVKRIARSQGGDISNAKPLLDARLPDGSRVAATFPPCSAHGITLTIRKLRPHWFTLAQLVEADALPASLAETLTAAVAERRTILVSGGTDTGKTTITKALIDLIPQDERLGVIEDMLELKIDHPDVFRFEARKEQRGPEGEVVVEAVIIRDLVKASLRHRPDRLIIGEVRGGEAFDLIDALNTGHNGSISTIHAISAIKAGIDLPYRAIQAEIGDLMDLVVHVERRHGKRYVTEVIEVENFDPDTQQFHTRSVYARTQTMAAAVAG